MYRRWKDSRGKDKEYENIIRWVWLVAEWEWIVQWYMSLFNCCYRKQVSASRSEAEKDNVVVPTTIEEYCIKHKNKPQEVETDMTDFYDDDYGDEMDDEDIEDDEDYKDDNEDSGNGESWLVQNVYAL